MNAILGSLGDTLLNVLVTFVKFGIFLPIPLIAYKVTKRFKRCSIVISALIILLSACIAVALIKLSF